MTLLRTAILLIAVVLGGWLAYDGSRAFLRGDYTTPNSGPHAGQLGPWANLVSRTGLDPRGTAVKAIHVALGLVWLTSAAAFFFRPAIGSVALLVSSVCTPWYLPIGTVLAIVELVLLLLPHLRALE